MLLLEPCGLPIDDGGIDELVMVHSIALGIAQLVCQSCKKKHKKTVIISHKWLYQIIKAIYAMPCTHIDVLTIDPLLVLTVNTKMHLPCTIIFGGRNPDLVILKDTIKSNWEEQYGLLTKKDPSYKENANLEEPKTRIRLHQQQMSHLCEWQQYP